MPTRSFLFVLIVIGAIQTAPLFAQDTPSKPDTATEPDLDAIARRLEAAKAAAAKKEQANIATEEKRKAAELEKQREAERKQGEAAAEEQAKRLQAAREAEANQVAVPKVLTIQPFSLSVPAAVLPSGFESGLLERVVAADLNRSGAFVVEISAADSTPVSAAGDASSSNAALHLEGRILPGKQSGLVVQFELKNRGGERLLGLGVAAKDSDGLRAVAHQIADILFEKISGRRGVAWTRIAYVLRSKSPTVTYSIMVADADGGEPNTVAKSREPFATPTWSPDGHYLAYVSGEIGRPALYYQEISTGHRRRILEEIDYDAHPSFSADGRQIALSVKRDTTRRIYRLDVETSHLEPLSDSAGDDTDPNWLSDGRIIFARTQAQSSSIKSMLSSTGQLTAIENIPVGLMRTAAILDGEKVWVAGTESVSGGQVIVIYELAFNRADHRLQLSPTSAIGQISFAPNGRMLLYSVHEDDKEVMYAVAANARVRQRLRSAEGDVFDGAWAPYRPR